MHSHRQLHLLFYRLSIFFLLLIKCFGVKKEFCSNSFKNLFWPSLPSSMYIFGLNCLPIFWDSTFKFLLLNWRRKCNTIFNFPIVLWVGNKSGKIVVGLTMEKKNCHIFLIFVSYLMDLLFLSFLFLPWVGFFTQRKL